MKSPIRTLASFVFAVGIVGSAPSAAGEYPERPVNIIVPLAAGGGADLMARQLAQQLSEEWGQQVLVINRPGASTQIGADSVAKSKPDGYNLLFTSNPHTVNPGLFKTLPYDTEKDFAPITLLAEVPLLLVAHPSLGVNSVKEVIALAKEKPGTINYSDSGIGGPGHMAMEVLKYKTGTDMVHVPFKGTGQALPALLGGETQLSFASGIATLPYIESGALKVLAVSGGHRIKSLPDVPTVAEAADIRDFAVVSWYGLLASAGTPKEVVDKIQATVAKALDTEAMSQLLEKSAGVKVASSPDEFAQFIHNEIESYSEVIKAANIVVEQ
ncbi:MAG: Bug family tripartite tricarboxylate transporter substrate binding protein [Dongiaceae bacterium]